MILLISFFKANLSNFPNIHNLARAIRVVTLQSIVHVSVKIDDMRVLPPAFFPKKISFSSSSFLFFIDSNGMMMVYKENNISETKKVERKLPEDFQFPVILRLVSLSLLMQSGHMCENLLFLTNFSKTLEEIMVIPCQQTKNAKL